MGKKRYKKYVYKITNLINGKVYIGQTNNIKRRIREHISGKRRNSLIHLAIKKYGWDNFDVQTLYYGENYNEEEKKWIEFYNSRNKKLGYNILEGGEDSVGENNPAAINTEHQVEWAKVLISKTRLSYNEISKRIGIKIHNLKAINQGQSWFDENEVYPLRNPKLTYEEVNKIIKLLKTSDFSEVKIAKMIDIDRSIVHGINIGEKYKREDVLYPIRQPCEIEREEKHQEVVKLLLETNLTFKEISLKVGISKDTVGKINNGSTRHKDYLDYPIRKDNKIHGVRQMDSGKWCARIKIQNTEFHLGTYNTKEEAENARLEAEKKKELGEEIV